MKSRLEAQIAAMLRRGKRPVITISPGLQVVPPKRPRGRPRTRDPQNRYAHFAAKHGSTYPYCRAKGCRNYLKMHQTIACSQECADQIFNYAMNLLRNIQASAEEILAHLSAAESKTA